MDTQQRYRFYCSDEDITLRGSSFQELFDKVNDHLIQVHHTDMPCDELDRYVRSQMKIEEW